MILLHLKGDFKPHGEGSVDLKLRVRTHTTKDYNNLTL